MKGESHKRAGDERLLLALRMRDEGASLEEITRVCGYSSTGSTRALISKVKKDYELSCRSLK